MRKRFTAIRHAILVALLLLLEAGLAASAADQLRIIDGDTLVLLGETIRLEGIDAPELAQTCPRSHSGTYRCGQKAKSHLDLLARHGTVSCIGTERDAFDRRLATCFSGDINLNKAMVADGHAYAFRRYSQNYIGEEASAKLAKRGVWQATSMPPWEFRQKKWQVAKQTAPAGCPIKGNISKRGRIYHTPWSPYYARTRINEASGERWFCSEIEAVAAGWLPPAR